MYISVILSVVILVGIYTCTCTKTLSCDSLPLLCRRRQKAQPTNVAPSQTQPTKHREQLIQPRKQHKSSPGLNSSHHCQRQRARSEPCTSKPNMSTVLVFVISYLSAVFTHAFDVEWINYTHFVNHTTNPVIYCTAALSRSSETASRNTHRLAYCG